MLHKCSLKKGEEHKGRESEEWKKRRDQKGNGESLVSDGMRRGGEGWKPEEKSISRYRELSHRLKCFRHMGWDKDLKSAIKYDNERTLKNVFPILN